jgi:hypothetical protein
MRLPRGSTTSLVAANRDQSRRRDYRPARAATTPTAYDFRVGGFVDFQRATATSFPLNC